MSEPDFNAVRFADYTKGLEWLSNCVGIPVETLHGQIGFWLDKEQKQKLVQAAKDYNAFYELPIDERVAALNRHNAKAKS